MARWATRAVGAFRWRQSERSRRAAIRRRLADLPAGGYTSDGAPASEPEPASKPEPAGGSDGSTEQRASQHR